MRNRHHKGAVRATLAILLSMASAVQAQESGRFAFAQPAQDLGDALRGVALRTGRNVIAPDALVRSRPAPALSGAFTAEEAIERLLEGSGLRSRQVDGALIIERTGPDRARFGPPPGDAPGEIVVTGSHVRAGAPTSPVLTITRRDIDEAAPSSVEGLMRRLPQNLSSGVAQENFGVSGAGADITDHGAGINLRGLGQRATLVLVNGRRTAPSGTGAFVDVSLIPVSAVERVEILTDGASAIYGSDAVAGVVNLLLRDDFRGLETVGQLGVPTQSGGRNLLAGATAGGGWGSGRAMLAYEFRAAGAISADERDFTINLPPSWSLFPRERRHSLYGTARQDLGSAATLDFSATYAARDTDRSYYIAGPLVPVDAQAEARSLGGSATLSVDLGASWRGIAAASYFRSRGRQRQDQPGGAGFVNLLNSRSSVREFELKADGDLLALPGGAAKLALGGQLRREAHSSLFQTQVNIPAPKTGSREVAAAFAELNLPLVTGDNRRAGVERLLVTAAGRFEHYEGLGSTFNPKLGLLWSPARGLNLRSSYGTSFRAPLLSETLGLYNVFLFPASLLYLDPSEAPAGVGAALVGSNPDVRPETSKSFTLGGDWSPPSVPKLQLRAAYYAIRFSNRIALPTPQIVVIGNPALEPIVLRDPASSFVNELFAGAGQLLDFSGPGFTSGGAGPEDVLVIVDARIANSSQTRTSGLDLGVDYGLDLGAHRLRLSLNANKVFRFDDRLTRTSPAVRRLDTPYQPLDWRARAGLSWSHGALSASLFANHAGAYTDNRTATPRKIRAWTTFDAGLAYTGAADARPALRNLRLSVNAENLFDADPPQLLPDPGSTRGVGYDPVNASGRGRSISLQVRKAW